MNDPMNAGNRPHVNPQADGSVQSLDALLCNGRLHRMLILAAKIGQSSGTFDPLASLDRKELRKWHDQVIAALSARTGRQP